MKSSGQTGLKARLFMAVCIYGMVAFFLAGCAAESPNPLAVENLNGDPPKQEKLSIELDARGIINGSFQPGGVTPYRAQMYPINYTGDWSLIHATKSQWYMAMSAKPGSRIDVVATMSRVVFDFWDYEFYADPGKVTFLVDEKPLGTFDLARSRADGQKYLNYQVTTQKNTVATVSMIIESGRAVVVGFLINALDEKFPY
jgi:hypothetical protein